MTTYTNSIQQVSFTIPSGATSATQTISAVGATAYALSQGQNTSSNTGNDQTHSAARIELTNSTTVTAFRNASSTATITVNVVVIDANSSLIKSVQSGTVSIAAGTTGTATISSVTAANSVVAYLGQTTSTSSFTATHLPGVTLTNATTVTANVNTSGTHTVGFVVIEFQGAVLNQAVQQFSGAFTSASTADTQTIASVTPANSIIIYGGFTSSSSNFGDSYAIQLTGATTVTLTRTATTTGTRTPYYAVVEFISGVLNSVQRSTVNLNSVTSNTATITGVNTSNAYCGFNGESTNATTTNNASRFYDAIALTNSTTVTGTVQFAVSSNTAEYEVVEFAGGAPPTGAFVFIGGFL